MKLLSDRVKVEVLPEKTVMAGDIYIAPNPLTGYRENYFRGKVIQTGKGRNIHCNIIPVSVKKDDIVMYPLSDYKAYKEKGKTYHIIYETDIYAVLEED